MEMSRLKPDGTAKPVSRDQILRRERGQGNIHFSCSADDEKDWQPYPVDPYSLAIDMCYHTFKIFRGEEETSPIFAGRRRGGGRDKIRLDGAGVEDLPRC